MINNLRDPTVDLATKRALLEKVKNNPESFAPVVFVDLIQSILVDGDGETNLEEAIMWYARLMFRTRVDIVVMSRDETLADIPELFGTSVKGMFSSLMDENADTNDIVELYSKAYAKAKTWDRETARQYDRRWASTHSLHGMLHEEEAKLYYLEDDKLAEVQRDVAKEEYWLSALEKWAATKPK